MHNQQQREQITIAGLSINTTNKDGAAFNDIMPLWQRFMGENIPVQIPNKVSDNLYGVYCRYQGRDVTTLKYTLIIGCEVDSTENLPEAFDYITIPAGNYEVSPVESAEPEQQGALIGKAWQQIWQDKEQDKRRTFIADFEQYTQQNGISIWIGVK